MEKDKKGKKKEGKKLFLNHSNTITGQSHRILVGHVMGKWVLRFLSSETEWEDDAATERISPAEYHKGPAVGTPSLGSGGPPSLSNSAHLVTSIHLSAGETLTWLFRNAKAQDGACHAALSRTPVLPVVRVPSRERRLLEIMQLSVGEFITDSSQGLPPSPRV